MLTLFVSVLMAGSLSQMPPTLKPFPVEYVERSARQGRVEADE